jgi:hypothetical protein
MAFIARSQTGTIGHVTGCNDYAVQRIYAEHVETLLVRKFTKQHGHPPVLHYGHKGHNAKEVDACIRSLRGETVCRDAVSEAC